MPGNWYYKLGPIVAGPFSKVDFGVRVAAGDIRPKTLVRKESDGQWVLASMVEGLLSSPANSTPAIQSQTTSDEVAADTSIPIAQPVADPTGVTSPSRRPVLPLLVVAIGLLLCIGVFVALRGQPSAEPVQANDGAVDQVALMRAEIANLQDRIKRIDALKDQPADEPAAPVQNIAPAEPVAEPAVAEEPAEDDEPKPLPPEIVQQIEAAKKAKVEDQRKQQARLVERIYEQRAILAARWEIAKQKLQQLQNDMSNAETDLARCQIEGAALEQNAAVLQRQIREVQETLVFEKDASQRARLQAVLSSGTTAYAQGQARYQTLDAAAAQARLNYARLQPQAQAASIEVAQLYQQGDQLRTEWLNTTNVFGKLVNGDYAAAIVEFAEWIILEPDNPVPYVARGLAHHYAGHPNLAVPDFQQASRLDPNRTAMMIREFQDFVNGVQPQQKAQPKQRGRKRK